MKGAGGAAGATVGGSVGTGGPGGRGSFSGGGAERSAGGNASSFSSRSFADHKPAANRIINTGPSHKGMGHFRPSGQSPFKGEMVSRTGALDAKPKFASSASVRFQAEGRTSVFNLNQPISEMARGKMRAPEKTVQKTGKPGRQESFRASRSFETHATNPETASKINSTREQIRTFTTKPNTFIETPRTVNGTSDRRTTPDARPGAKRGLFEKASSTFAAKKQVRKELMLAKTQKSEQQSSLKTKTQPVARFDSLVQTKQSARAQTEVSPSAKTGAHVKHDSKVATKTSVNSKTRVELKTQARFKTEFLTRARERVRLVLGRLNKTDARTQTMSLPDIKSGSLNGVMPASKMEQVLSQRIESLAQSETATNTVTSVKTQPETQTLPKTQEQEDVQEKAREALDSLPDEKIEELNDEKPKEKKLKVKVVRFLKHFEMTAKRSEITVNAFWNATYEAIFTEGRLPNGQDVVSHMSMFKHGKNAVSPSVDGIEPDGSIREWVGVFANAGEIKSVDEFRSLLDQAQKRFPATVLADGEKDLADKKQVVTVHNAQDTREFDANYEDKRVKVRLGQSSNDSPTLVIAEEAA